MDIAVMVKLAPAVRRIADVLPASVVIPALQTRTIGAALIAAIGLLPAISAVLAMIITETAAAIRTAPRVMNVPATNA
jgi:hypothetical protein